MLWGSPGALERKGLRVRQGQTASLSMKQGTTARHHQMRSRCLHSRYTTTSSSYMFWPTSFSEAPLLSTELLGMSCSSVLILPDQQAHYFAPISVKSAAMASLHQPQKYPSRTHSMRAACPSFFLCFFVASLVCLLSVSARSNSSRGCGLLRV